jgi:hypothetical protein
MQAQDKRTWRSPEEIVEICFQRSQTVMMNEAHSGPKRCSRNTRSDIYLNQNWSNLQKETLIQKRLFIYCLVL